MPDEFFERPILNSPYEYPARHWELDESGQPTQRIVEKRREARFITPIPEPRKQRGATGQGSLVLGEHGLSTAAQQYAHTAIINGIRQQVDRWRQIPNPADWRVTPETARLVEHWRHHRFGDFRPFFCQLEAVETIIWLTETAPQLGKAGESALTHLANANRDANPDLCRIALKLASGAGKTVALLRAEWKRGRGRKPLPLLPPRLPYIARLKSDSVPVTHWLPRRTPQNATSNPAAERGESRCMPR
jgi:type III restriction enzyme